MENQENNENTKEIKNLDELRNAAIDTLELTEDLLSEFDENLDDSTEAFEVIAEEKKEEIENLEETEPDTPKAKEQKKKKTFKEKMASLKEKWQKMSTPKKAGIIFAIVAVIVLIIFGIILLLPKEKEDTTPKVPDVILKENNYRYENGILVFLDKNEKEIGRYECQNKDQELCYVAWNNEEDNFDEPKTVYENGEKIEERTGFFLDQYAFVYDNEEKDNGLITLYDFKSEKDLETYHLVKTYQSLENMVILKNKADQYGLYRLTLEGIEPVIPNSYEYLGVIENNKPETNKIVAKRNGKWYLTDLQDKTLTKAIDHEIKDYNETHIKTRDESGSYHLVDYNNVEINADNYEYIDLIENYALFIKDKKMLIRDYNNNKMNVNGIELENTNYLPVSTYSEKDNKLIKTEKSYEITYQGNIMRVEVQKENGKTATQINMNEGRISATLANLEYFDGVLYIYENAEKTNLLGSYNCTNKNTMSDETTELNNCKLARESFFQDNDQETDRSADLGVLPIYNKRFAFIEDATSNNQNIVLYDLKTNETKARYKSVDAGAYTKTNNANFVTANGSIVLAETQNNTFGAIKIDYENVSSAIGFNYNHIERIGFYYLAQDSSGYFLVDQSGNRKTDAATNKIANYNDTANYVTRKNASNYYLYPFSGNGSNLGYNYIELYDKYYAAVTNNTLKLFSYQDQETDLLESSEIPKLNSTDYTGEKPAFKITINNQNATVEILLSNGNYEKFKVNLEKDETPSVPVGTEE